MNDQTPVLSICMTCRDGRASDCQTRGGTRLAERVLTRWKAQPKPRMHVRGIHCMTQCKRPCVASLSAEGGFTYIFGDLDPQESAHVEALFELAAHYRYAPEGFLERKDRPKPLQASILGRLPPLGSRSQLVSNFETGDP